MRRSLISTTLLAIALATAPALPAADLAELESKVAAAGLKAEAADLLALSTAYEAASRPLEAGATLERAIAAGAGTGHRRRLGRLWEAAGRFDQAALAYKAAGTGPDGAAAALDAAHLVGRTLDDRRRASAEYVAVAKGWPKSPQAREALLAVLAGDRWRDDLRDLRAEAEDLALAQFAAEPAFADGIAGAARRMAERKQGDQALALVRTLPDGPARQEAEAEILVRLGRGGEAADQWERRWTASRDPNHLLKAAECVDNADRPRAARLWLTCAAEHPDNRPAWEFLERAWGFDPKAIPAAAETLAKAWAGSQTRLAALALYRARAGAGDRAALVKDAIARDADALGLDALAEVARADAGARAAIAERGKADDRAGWVLRLAAALAQDGEPGLKAVAETIRDGGLLDEGTARRALQLVMDRLWERRDKAETAAQVAAFVRTVTAAPQPNDVREMAKRMAQEFLRDKAAREAALQSTADDPVARAWSAKGHQALARLLAEPPAGIHPLRLLAVRQETVRRAWDRRETYADAAAAARPAAASPEWAVRWAEVLVQMGDGVDRAQIAPALEALAPVAGAAGARQERALRLTAALHLTAGRPADAAKAVAALPGKPADWSRDTRWTAAQAAAAVADRPLYERILDAAAAADGDLTWEMTASNRWRAPDEWRIPLAERAATALRDARRRTELLTWVARARRDANDGPGTVAALAKAREAAAGDARALEQVLLMELDAAQRRRDAAAEDAAARGLIANSERAVADWRGVGEGLRRWLEPRLAGLPADAADAALKAVMRTGNQSGLWAAARLAERQRPQDPTAAAITVQQMVRLAWREDREAFDTLQALVQAEADAGRAGIAAGAFAQMAVWFSAERVGQDRIDGARRQAAALLAKAGGAALIDDRDPKAPLLRAAAQLAGGDEDEAWRLIKDQQKLLTEHIGTAPADLVLLAARRFAGEGRTDTARTLVESLLRSQRDDGEGPARARLLLGDLAFRDEDLPAATLEFQQVIATWPKSRAALEAQLRLGDCLLAARQAEQARKIYEQFAEHEDDETRIRAHARLAMLEIQAGNKPKALELFREIAAMNPPRALADELYLDWGRALIGANRLQEAEDVLTMVGLAQGEDPVAPGEPLRITLRDPYLQTSQARTAVPVVVRTASGDEEVVDMTLSAEAKGVFAARIPTALGAPVKGDRTLQVRGGDAITYDYTEDFKKGRKVVALGSGGIPIASDAQFKAAATLDGVAFAGESESKEQGLLNLGVASADDEEAQLARSASRTYRQGNQLKPGNPIYLAVMDADRDTGPEADRIAAILQSTAGDRVQVDLIETGPHTGLFQAEVATGLRPADLAVSDSAPGADPAAMLAQPGSPDHDRGDRAWIAAGDRKPGKTVTVDLKQVVPVDRLVWSRGKGAADRKITGYRIEASADGTGWSTFYDSKRANALTGALRWTARAPARGGATRTTRAAGQVLANLSLAPVRGQRAPEGVTTARGAEYVPAADAPAGAEHLAEGRIVIPAPGRYEFAVRGNGRAWVMVDGRMVVEKDRDERDEAGEPRWRGGLDLAYGQAAIKVLHGSEAGPAGLTLLWRRPGQTVFEPIPAAAIDEAAAAKDVAALVGGTPATATALGDRPGADVAFKPFSARFVRMVIDEWADGDAPAIAAITVSHADKRLVPAPGVDYAALAANQVLELSAGDEVTASYRDEKTKRKVPEILRSRLSATYYDGSLIPLETRTSLNDGKLEELVFQRYRFRAGETISVRVTEFDADTTNQPDKVQVKVTSSAGSVVIDAVETGKATGEFQGEVRTRAAGGSASAPARTLLVKPGEQVQISYLDLANVRPGGPAERRAFVREVVESAGAIAVLPTIAAPVTGPGQRAWTLGAPAASAAVVLAPLHIQVTDPDALTSAGSRIRVRIATARGAEQDVLLAPGGDPETGIFAGSVALALGSPADGTLRILPPGVERGTAAPAEPGAVGAVPVIPVAGGEAITVTYLEGLARTATAGAAAAVAARGGLPTATARLGTAGALRLTEDDYETPVTMLHVAGKLCMLVTDPDADTGDGRDEVEVEIRAASGDRLVMRLGETELHSGVFTGSIPLTQGAAAADQALQVALGDRLAVTYREAGAARPPAAELPVAKGHDADLSVFAKRFADDRLAARTQLRLAESWFEIYKRQRADLRTMERAKGKPADIAALKAAIEESLGEGISLLQRTVSDDPDGAEADQVLFLLGNFEQEAGNHDSAIDRYRSLLGQFPDSARAAEAQYKIAQCHEERKRFDDAWEAYVRLAYRWPEHELVADAMARIGLFYDDRGRALAKAAKDAWLQANPGGDAALAPVPATAIAEFTQAAAVYAKLVERFPDHRIADQIMLAQGNSLYQCARYLEAKAVFDAFLAKYPNSPALPKGLFWAASAALEAGDAPGAYLRFGRLVQDYPESNEAKFARGRLLTDKRLKGIALVGEEK